MAKELCVLDVRSNTVTLATGECSNKGLINITGIATEEYEGYFDGQWLNSSSFEDAVSKAYHPLSPREGHDVLYVGVPSAFCSFYGDVYYDKINESSVITSKLIDSIAERGKLETGNSYDIILKCALGYKVDGGEAVTDPIGMSGNRLESFMSYIMCHKSFAMIVKNILPVTESAKAEYICSAHAQAMTLLDPSYRSSGEIFLDLGFLECGVAGVRGDGLQGLESVTTGAAVIAADLTESLGVDIYSAMSLFGQIDLMSDYDDGSFYSVPQDDGKVLQYRSSEINEVVRNSIKNIAAKISDVLGAVADDEACKRIFATGDAIFNIRGAIKYMAKCLDKTITPLSPNVLGYDDMRYSSLISLMRQAQIRKSESGLFNRIISKFRRA